MHYVIYPDTLFLENLICNFLMLSFLKIRYFPNTGWKKILSTAVLIAFCNTVTAILFFHYHWMIQGAVTFPCTGFIVCMSMKIRESRRILLLLYQMMLWILAVGGILQILEQWMALSAAKVVLTVGCFTVLYGILEKIISIYERQNQCMREIVLYWGGTCCHFRGFADTGNQLVDPFSKKAVTLISPDAWEKLLGSSLPPKYYMIPFHSVGNSRGLIRAAQIDYMVILEGKESKVVERPVIAITERSFEGLFRYSVLLHNKYC